MNIIRDETGRFIKGFKYPKEWADKRIRPEGLVYKLVKPNPTSFKKGHTSWNKDKKGIRLSSNSEFKKGQHTSPKTEIKKGQYAKEKHPNWKGGISPKSSLIRNSVEYSLWRKKIFERDAYTCQSCGQQGVRLQADHYPISFSTILEQFKIKTLKQALACEKVWDINNGRTLCVRCHEQTVTYLNPWIKAMK